MGVHGLEPWTSSLSGTRSNQTELHARNVYFKKIFLQDFYRINFFEKLSMGRGERFKKGEEFTRFFDVKL